MRTLDGLPDRAPDRGFPRPEARATMGPPSQGRRQVRYAPGVSNSKALTTATDLERDRARSIERLSQAFEDGHIELDELERRLARARAAETTQALSELLDAGWSDVAPAVVPPRPASVPRYTLAFAIMGGTTRKGAWTVPRTVNAFALMGGVELDLSNAVLGDGVTDIWACAIMGGVEIIAPSNIRVECEGLGILGSFEDKTEVHGPIPEHAPTVRIRGIALMGGVEVSTRNPGASAETAQERLEGTVHAKPSLPSGLKRP